MKIANVMLVLAAPVVVSLSACGGENANNNPPQSPQTTSGVENTQPNPGGSSVAPSNATSAQQSNENNAADPNRNMNPSNTFPNANAGNGDSRNLGNGASSSANSNGNSGANRQNAPSSTLNDSQIAQIAADINQGEIDQARYVEAHSKNQQVLTFARHMVADHTDIGQRMNSLLESNGITPAFSSTDNDVKSSAQETLATMQGKTGRDLDKDYIDAQVKEHQDALDMLETKLIPYAQNMPFKAQLESVRAKVATHLAQAQALQSAISSMK